MLFKNLYHSEMCIYYKISAESITLQILPNENKGSFRRYRGLKGVKRREKRGKTQIDALRPLPYLF